MPRPDRLFRLLHAFRVLPQPVTAARLAEEMGVSERTLYRDIDSLRLAGALIDGEAGYGYRLVEDLAVPPQQFSRIELEALLLGLSEVRHMGDRELAGAAESAMAKLVASLPERLQRQAAHAVLKVYRYEAREAPPVDLSLVRQACWDENAIRIAYADAAGSETERTVWPLCIAYLDKTLMLLAWCCLRQDFRKFRVDRMHRVVRADESFRPRRVPLLRQFIDEMGQSSGERMEGAQARADQAAGA